MKRPLATFVAVQVLWMALLFAIWVGSGFLVSIRCGGIWDVDQDCVSGYMLPVTIGVVIAALAPPVAYAIAAQRDAEDGAEG